MGRHPLGHASVDDYLYVTFFFIYYIFIFQSKYLTHLVFLIKKFRLPFIQVMFSLCKCPSLPNSSIESGQYMFVQCPGVSPFEW
uniref:Uncharacterized protein n=1 Tax=Nelumbo nucifera TaxID=4432 RepID=A0A822Y5S0_NELNU|nr:TPA_asm: hypothetical protein HUJ06_028831 [Nelumbo nucifera]